MYVYVSVIAREFVRRSIRRMSGRRRREKLEENGSTSDEKGKDGQGKNYADTAQVNLGFQEGDEIKGAVPVYKRENSEFYELSANNAAVVSGPEAYEMVQPKGKPQRQRGRAYRNQSQGPTMNQYTEDALATSTPRTPTGVQPSQAHIPTSSLPPPSPRSETSNHPEEEGRGFGYKPKTPTKLNPIAPSSGYEPKSPNRLDPSAPSAAPPSGSHRYAQQGDHNANRPDGGRSPGYTGDKYGKPIGITMAHSPYQTSPDPQDRYVDERSPNQKDRYTDERATSAQDRYSDQRIRNPQDRYGDQRSPGHIADQRSPNPQDRYGDQRSPGHIADQRSPNPQDRYGDKRSPGHIADQRSPNPQDRYGDKRSPGHIADQRSPNPQDRYGDQRYADSRDRYGDHIPQKQYQDQRSPNPRDQYSDNYGNPQIPQTGYRDNRSTNPRDRYADDSMDSGMHSAASSDRYNPNVHRPTYNRQDNSGPVPEDRRPQPSPRRPNWDRYVDSDHPRDGGHSRSPGYRDGPPGDRYGYQQSPGHNTPDKVVFPPSDGMDEVTI